MATLQKLDILTAGRLKTDTIEVDGDQIIISEIGAADSIRLLSDPRHRNEKGNLSMADFGPALVAACVVDDTGARVFSDDDIPDVGRLKPQLFKAMLDKALLINGIGQATEGDDVKN